MNMQPLQSIIRNPFQQMLKKALHYPSDLVARMVLKSMPIAVQPLGLDPFVDNRAGTTSGSSSENNNQRQIVNQSSTCSFESALNKVDPELYQPFVMHIEGYKNIEIAEYLGLTESEVAFTVIKVKDLLRDTADLPLD